MVMMEQVHTGEGGSLNHHRMNKTKRGRWEMLKRLLIIGTLCIGIMALGGTDAHAWPASSSGWAADQNTVTIYSGWRGIANKDLRPTSVKLTLFPKEVMVLCDNHGGNDGGVGVPFMYPTTLTGNQTSPEKATRNGRWDSYITFTDNELLGNLTDPNSYCINPNWTAKGIVVKTFDVYIQAYEDIDSTCPDIDPPDSNGLCYTTSFNDNNAPLQPYNAEEVVRIKGSCDLESAPIGVGSQYTCTTPLQWEWSKKYPTCDDQFSDTCEVPW